MKKNYLQFTVVKRITKKKPSFLFILLSIHCIVVKGIHATETQMSLYTHTTCPLIIFCIYFYNIFNKIIQIGYQGELKCPYISYSRVFLAVYSPKDTTDKFGPTKGLLWLKKLRYSEPGKVCR